MRTPSAKLRSRPSRPRGTWCCSDQSPDLGDLARRSSFSRGRRLRASTRPATFSAVALRRLSPGAGGRPLPAGPRGATAAGASWSWSTRCACCSATDRARLQQLFPQRQTHGLIVPASRTQPPMGIAARIPLVAAILATAVTPAITAEFHGYARPAPGGRQRYHDLLIRYGLMLDGKDFHGYADYSLATGLDRWIWNAPHPRGDRGHAGEEHGPPRPARATGHFHLLTNEIITVKGDRATAVSKLIFTSRVRRADPCRRRPATTTTSSSGGRPLEVPEARRAGGHPVQRSPRRRQAYYPFPG